MTKARTKTQKRTVRRGRPRIEGCIREPNGRISRAKNPASKHALETRARKYHLSIDQANDPRAASYIGRLSLLGKYDGLSKDQYEAALKFLELHNTYRRSILSPGAYYEHTGKSSTNESDMEEYAQWVARVKRRYKAALNAIQEAQFDNGHENLYGALQYVIIEDKELPNLIGATRMVLNCLHRYFELSSKPKAETKRAQISLSGFTPTTSKMDYQEFK